MRRQSIFEKNGKVLKTILAGASFSFAMMAGLGSIGSDSPWITVAHAEDSDADYVLSKTKMDKAINRETKYKNLVITTTPAPSGVTTTDVSETGNGKVLLYINTDTKTVYICPKESGHKVKAPADSSYFFAYDSEKGMTSLYYIEKYDVAGLDVSGVTDMSFMFSGGMFRKSIDVSGWDTSGVTTMEGMFSNNQEMTSLDVSNFDTSNVTNMNSMFSGLYATTFNIGDPNTSKVTDMSYMFQSMQISSIDVSVLETSNVDHFTGMFKYCSNLTTIKGIEDMDTSKAVNIASMFMSVKFTSVDLSKWTVPDCTNVSGLFSGCNALQSVDISGMSCSKAKNMNNMFYNNSALTTLKLSKDFTTCSATKMSGTFYNCEKLSLDPTMFDYTNVTTTAGMFYNCKNLVSKIDFSNRKDLSNITDMSKMFGLKVDSKAWPIQQVYFTNADMSSCTTMEFLFGNQQCLNVVDFTGAKMDKVENLNYALGFCTDLQTVKMGDQKFPACKDFGQMFQSDYYLESLDLHSMTSESAETLYCMFDGCKCLTYLNISGIKDGIFNPGAKVEYMFGDTINLKTLCADERIFDLRRDEMHLGEDVSIHVDANGDDVCDLCGNEISRNRITGASLYLNGTIGINVYFQLTDDIAKDSTTKIYATNPYSGEEESYSLSSIKKENGYYVVSEELPPCCGAERIVISYSTSKKQKTEVGRYSIDDYCCAWKNQNNLSSSDPNYPIVSLCLYLERYCYYSTAYFGYGNVEDYHMASYMLFDSTNDMVRYIDYLQPIFVGKKTDYPDGYVGNSLMFLPTIVFRTYYSEPVSGYTGEKNGMYYIDQEMSPAKLGPDGSMICPYKYMYKVLYSSETDDLSKYLCAALYDYSVAFKQLVTAQQ